MMISQAFHDLSGSLRLFFGIPVPSEIENYVSSLIPIDRSLKWITGPDLHITLNFIGNCDHERAEKLLGIDLSHLNSFHIQPEKVEIKNRRRGGLAWLKCSAAPGIRLLHHELSETLYEKVSLPKEERSFTPHITILRSKHPIRAEIPPPPPSIQFTVTKFQLYQTVNSGGVRYKVIREYPLNKKAPYQD